MGDAQREREKVRKKKRNRGKDRKRQGKKGGGGAQRSCIVSHVSRSFTSPWDRGLRRRHARKGLGSEKQREQCAIAAQS